MSVTFSCPCGESLAAEEEHAGLTVECPTCRKHLTVPGLTPIFDADDRLAPPPKPPAPPPPKTKPRVADDEDDEDDERPKKKKKKRKNHGDDDEDPHVRALMRKANADLDEEEYRRRREGGGIAFTPGIIAGLAMLVFGLLGIAVMICVGFISIRLMVFCAAFAIVGLVRAVLSFNGQGFD